MVFQNKTDEIIKNIGKVIVGREKTIAYLMAAALAQGHVLIEDVPGTGKTKLARAFAASIDAEYSRIQFTPDLLPSDVTGLNIYNRKMDEFELRKGPVFTNILLADEINRATPRTQAGLLECMEERQVTIDGECYTLEFPFMVIATQNPLETSGTFPLPEAQLDRFMMKLSMGLPNREEELSIIERFMKDDPIKELRAVITKEELLLLRDALKDIYVHPVIEEYMVDIILGTRNQEKIVMGVSTRGTLALLRAVKAYAAIQGRAYVIPDDIKELAVPVLAHRLVLSYGYQKGKAAQELMMEIVGRIAVPTEQFWDRV